MSSTPCTKKRSSHAERIAERLSGVYIADDVRDETILSLKQMKGDDKVITLIQHAGVFSVYDNSEFLPQIAEWRRMHCVMRKKNTRELTIDGKKVHMFIIQPPEGKHCNFCPLAMAHGVMVSGYAYLTPYKSTVELVERVLGV